MATGPGDQVAAAGRGRLRTSHADREQVIDTLKAAFVQGRLAKDEFDARVGHALTSRTCADLAALTADIPAGLTGAEPPRKPARAQSRPPVSTPVKSGVCVIIAAIMMLAAPYAGTALLVVAVIVFVASFIAWASILSAQPEKRSRGKLPQQPAPCAGGKASRRAASAASAEQLPQSNQAQRNTAEAVRSRLPRPQLSGLRSPHQWRPGGRRYAIGCADR